MPVSLEDEIWASNRVRVRFYTVRVKGSEAPLKIDFIEDLFIAKPSLNLMVCRYNAKDVYFQKVIAATKEVRDIVDIYYLSKRVEALHKFLKSLSRQHQRGMIQWYRSYSWQDVKIGTLDLSLYDRSFDVSEMIDYLDKKIK